MAQQFWLMKSEPEVFSIADLAKAKTTTWEGVRNYQARNYLRAMKQGDGVLFYHSNAEPAGVAGTAEVAREAYADDTALDKKSEFYDPKATRQDPRWSRVDLRWTSTFPRVLTLEALRGEPKLQQMLVLRKGNRLSVTPVTPVEWKAVLSLARKHR